MTVRFGFKTSDRLRPDIGTFITVTDSLLEVLPPQPKRREGVEVWVFWPPQRGTRDSMQAPRGVLFEGPDPTNPLVYDYELHIGDTYRPVRFRLDDPVLSVWIDETYPAEYRSEIERAFEKWEHVLAPGRPVFQVVADREAAKIRVNNARVGAASAPLLNNESTRLLRSEIFMLLQDDVLPLPPPRNYFLSGVHEIGHALGIWSHSPYPGDVVGLFGDESLPSERDTATIRHLYERDSAITD